MVFSTTITYKVKKGRKPAKTLDSRLQAWQLRTLTLLQDQPGPSSGHPRWTSERQRRFVVGFVLKRDAQGRLQRYQRTGALAAAWNVYVDYAALEVTRQFTFRLLNVLATLDPRKPGQLGKVPDEGVLVSIFNKSPVMRYVEGFQQQGFHKDTGWIFAPTVVGDAVRELDGIVADTGFV